MPSCPPISFLAVSTYFRPTILVSIRVVVLLSRPYCTRATYIGHSYLQDCGVFKAPDLCHVKAAKTSLAHSSLSSSLSRLRSTPQRFLSKSLSSLVSRPHFASPLALRRTPRRVHYVILSLEGRDMLRSLVVHYCVLDPSRTNATMRTMP
jgi:hypothetical protein